MVCHLSSRLQVASGLRDFFSAATASAALIVSYHPRVALTNWMPSRMPASIQFWMANSMMMAIQIMIGMGPYKC